MHRFFWPREIWPGGPYGFGEMADMHAPGNKERAQWMQSAIVVDALWHATDATDALDYYVEVCSCRRSYCCCCHHGHHRTASGHTLLVSANNKNLYLVFNVH
jgi:hypothetical protein